MQFKAKIKTMNPQSIRGTRLFPAQVLTADSSKSIQIPVDLTRSSYQQPAFVDQALTQTMQSQSIRSAARHTTDFSATRPLVSRLSLDQAINNRASIEDTSRQNSQRTHNTSFQNKSTSNTKQSNFESINVARNSLQKDQNMFSNLKDLHIQRIQSIETAKTNEKLGHSQIQPIRQFSLQRDGLALKLFSKNSNLSNQNNSTFQSLYQSYKAKYDSLQADYTKMIQKFKICQQYIETLQCQRSRENENLSASRRQSQMIATQNKTISKLEQSIMKNRSINEMLMKKEREYERKIKKIQELQEQQWRKRAELLKQQIWNQAKNKNEENTLILQKINFQLKLKLIDQANIHEEELSKTKNKFQSLLQQKDNQIKQILAQMNSQKVQSNEEILFHLSESQNKSKIIGDLSCQVSQKQQMLQRLSHQLFAYKDQLNAYTFDNNQLLQQIQQNKRQKERIISNFVQQLNQERLNISKLQNEVQSLIQTVQDKENAIAKLNKQKTVSLLEILQLKNQIKVKTQQKDKDHLSNEALKRQIIDLNSSNNQLKAQKAQSQALINLFKQQLQDSRLYIASLKNSLADAQQQMELRLSQYQLKVYNLMRQLEDKTSQKDLALQQLQNLNQQFEQKIIQNSDEMTDQISQNLVFKMQILEQLKANKERISFLENQCQKLKEQAKQLESLNSTLQQQKKSYQQAVSDSRNKIIELTQALEQLRKQVSSEEQRKLKQKQISEREEELKKVQSQYLELIEGQLKKLYQTQQQNISFNDKQSSFQLVNFFSEKKLSSRQNSPSKSILKDKNQSFEDILEEEDLAKLRQQVYELTFVNDALKRKVEQLSQIQQSSNIVIMDRIKAFSQQMEAILEQKAKTEECNAQITLKIHQLTDKCIFYEGRIQWLQVNYKALEENLLQTQEELMKSEFKYINLKIKSCQVQVQQDALPQQQTWPIYIENITNQKEINKEISLEEENNFDHIEKNEYQPVDIQQIKSNQQEKDLFISAEEEICNILDSEVRQKQQQFTEEIEGFAEIQKECETSAKEERQMQQDIPVIHIIQVQSEVEDDKTQLSQQVKITVYTVLSQAEDQDMSIQQQQKQEIVACAQDPTLMDQHKIEAPLDEEIVSDQPDIAKYEDISIETKPFDILLAILNENHLSEMQDKKNDQKGQNELQSQSNLLHSDLSLEQMQQEDNDLFK